MDHEHRSQRIATIFAVLTVVGTALPLRASDPLTFDQAAAALRPHPRELEIEALLAEAASAAVGAGGILLEGPTAGVAAGPRRVDGETEGDLAVEVEVPLLAGRQRRLDLAHAIDPAAESMRSSARAIALADLAAAFSRTWLAQAEVDLRAEDVSIADAWLAATERRIEAGADPPYESILVAGERDRAALDLVAAREEVELAWGELSRLSSVDRASALDLGSLPASGDSPVPPTDAASVALAGIETERELATMLARARSAVTSSRWALAGDAGREGDERVARVGASYRFARGGERATIEELERTSASLAAAEATARAGEVRARLAAARAAADALPSQLDAMDFEAARRALDARVQEGKERASEVLPLRRQLLEAALARARGQAARARARAELSLLEGGDQP
jgi:hypothetical protein